MVADFLNRDVTVKRGAANALLRSQLICNNINVVAMPGGYKDPRVAPYLKGVKHVEPIQRKHNAEALPPGWAVAAHSQTLYRTGAKPPRVYYINEEGGNTSWSRPRDTRKDFEKYKLKEKHVKLLGDDRPSLVCKYDDKALVKLGKRRI